MIRSNSFQFVKAVLVFEAIFQPFIQANEIIDDHDGGGRNLVWDEEWLGDLG